MPPPVPEPPRALTKSQKRNLLKRRSHKALKSSAKDLESQAFDCALEAVSLTKQLKSSQLAADCFAKNADVASTDKKIIQRTLDNVTSKMVDQQRKIKAQDKIIQSQEQTIASLQLQVHESARLERTVSMERAASFVSDPRNQPH